MKITYKQLKQLIKEQVSSVILEQRAGSISDPAGRALSSGGFGFRPTTGGAAATSVIAPAAGAPSGGATGPSVPVRVDRPGRAGSGMAAIEPTRSSYEMTGAATMPTTPAAVSDNARQLFDDNSTSLKSGVTRFARLISRNQEAEAQQLLGWLPQSSRSGVARSRNISRYATEHNTGPLANAEFKNRVVSWARRAARVAAAVGASLPVNLEAIPPGSPERQQLVQRMTQLRGQLVALGNEWDPIERDFSTLAPGGGHYDYSRTGGATPAPTPSAAPAISGGAPLVAESRRRNGKIS